MKHMMRQSKRQTSPRHCMVVHARYPIGETRVEREALALVNQGYEVDVICMQHGDEPGEELVNGINVYRLPLARNPHSGALAQFFEYFGFFLLAFSKLTRLHWKRRYKVVQIHNLPDLLVFTGIIPKLMGARIVLDIHDLMPEFYAVRFNRPLSSWPVRLIILAEQISCRFAHQVITVTHGWRDVLQRRGVPARKLNVVMNVPDEGIFCPENGHKPERMNPGRFQLLYHGNLTQRYGIDLAIRAVDQVRAQIPNIHLYIHGGGAFRSELEEIASRMGLNEYVGFNKGPIPTEELPHMIQSADVCLVPYRRDIFTDGILPTKLMEYAALEMPVIAARTEAIQSYFDDQMVAYFDPEDVDGMAGCIRELYENPQRLAELKRGSQKFNQQYNWTKESSSYVALIDRLSGRKNGARR